MLVAITVMLGLWLAALALRKHVGSPIGAWVTISVAVVLALVGALLQVIVVASLNEAAGTSATGMSYIRNASLTFIISVFIIHYALREPKGSQPGTVAAESTDDEEGFDEHLYKTVWDEFENGEIRTSLWAKCFAESDGESDRAKALYLRHRVAEIKHQAISNAPTYSNDQEAEDSLSDEELMQKYDITYDQEHYFFRSYRYKRLSDAVNYARIDTVRNPNG